MLSHNPFAALSATVPAWAMQLYLLIMVALVVGGTLFDMVHKRNAAYFFQNRRKARASATRAATAAPTGSSGAS